MLTKNGALYCLSVTPHTQCRLKLLKQERIKDYLLMEEEFIRNQEQMKPLEEKQEVCILSQSFCPVCVVDSVEVKHLGFRQTQCFQFLTGEGLIPGHQVSCYRNGLNVSPAKPVLS